MNIKDAADGVESFTLTFVPNKEQFIPMYGPYEKFQRPKLQFESFVFEYFDGDTGKGLGAIIKQDGRTYCRNHSSFE